MLVIMNNDTQKLYFSGINPSSSNGLHLGNYLGAVKPQVELQDAGRTMYFIANYHALNSVYDPEVYASNVENTFLDYLALGIDTERTIFFIETDVPEITELSVILQNVITFPQMKRMHAFKDKLQAGADESQINMGLFNYPILMAADILIFNPDYVPVGLDQSQHVEIARDIAKGFNARYGEVLKVPELVVQKETAKVLGTDGERKMSKSLGNDISIFATEDKIRQQIMGIITDPKRIHPTDPGDPEKNVIFSYMKMMNFPEDKRLDYEERYRIGTVGDVEIKKDFLNFYLEYFAGVRKHREELVVDKEQVKQIREVGSQKARAIAQETIAKVRKAVGMDRF
jgi:tryptophanyl-tRNA synthetase